MMFRRKALSHLLLAVFAVGGLSCPCPAAAMTGHEAPTQREAHRHGHTAGPAAETDAREQAQCQADCEQPSAGASRKESSVYLAKPAFDPDIEALEPETAAWPGILRALTGTGPPPQSSRLPRETPVGRFDRLLD